MAKQYTEAEKKKLTNSIKKMPAGMQKLMLTSSKCVNHLISTRKIDHEKAQSMVLEILKEMESDIKAGHYNTCITMLEMIFMDKDVNKISALKILKDYE